MRVLERSVNMRDRIPQWEQELWHYISSGDGDNCPLYDNCQARLDGAWCIYSGGQCFDNGHRPVPPSNYDFIEGIRPGRIFELLELLAAKYLRRGRVRKAPVPSPLIALIDRDRNIDIRLVPLKVYHGAIWQLDDTWVINLNSHDPPEMRRLTLFHEAFHILAHCRATPVFKKVRSEKGSFNELLAENFAHHVLMPRKLLQEKWAQIQDPLVLARHFEVPQSAMISRLKSLHLMK